jgi:maltooligosyltrehalose trehalohydrolase
MQALDAHAIGPAAVLGRWQLGDHALLLIGINLGTSAVPVSQLNGRLLFATSTEAGQSAQDGTLQPYCTVVFMKTR